MSSDTRLTGEDPLTETKKPSDGCISIALCRSVSFVFFCACFVIHLASFGSPYWYEEAADDGEYVSFGLWAFCQTGFFTTAVECERIHTGRPSQLSFEMRAFQTNMTLALIANIITFVLYVLWFCTGKGRAMVAYLTPAMNAFGGLATIIATAVFGVYFTLDTSVLSWAFILACISGGIQILTGLITLFVVPCTRA